MNSDTVISVSYYGPLTAHALRKTIRFLEMCASDIESDIAAEPATDDTAERDDR
jgi:hypothetical protein